MVSIKVDRAHSISLTFNSGLTPFFGGMTAFDAVLTTTDFHYRWDEQPIKANDPVKSISRQTWTGIEKTEKNHNVFWKTTNNILLYGVIEACTSFVKQVSKPSCSTSCEYSQKVVGDSIDWRANC